MSNDSSPAGRSDGQQNESAGQFGGPPAPGADHGATSPTAGVPQTPGSPQTPGTPQTPGAPQNPGFPQTPGFPQASGGQQAVGFGQTPQNQGMQPPSVPPAPGGQQAPGQPAPGFQQAPGAQPPAPGQQAPGFQQAPGQQAPGAAPNPPGPHNPTPQNQANNAGWGAAATHYGQAVPDHRIAGPGNLQPGVVPLGAFGVGGVLEGAFKTLRRYPRQTIGMSIATNMIVAIVTVVALGSVGLQLIKASTEPAAIDNFFSQTTTLLAQAAVGFIVVTLLSAVVVVGQQLIFAAVTSQAVLGRDITLGRAWQMAIPRILPALLSSLIITVVSVLLLSAYIGASVLIIQAINDFGVRVLIGVIMVLIGMFVGLVLTGMVALTPAVVALENVGPIEAIVRCVQLTYRNFWRVAFGVFVVVFVTQFISGVIQQILGTVIQMAFFGVGAAAGEDLTQAGPSLIAISIAALAVQTLVTSITTAYAACGLVLVYFDTRMRQEGLDVTLLREVHESQNLKTT